MKGDGGNWESKINWKPLRMFFMSPKQVGSSELEINYRRDIGNWVGESESLNELLDFTWLYIPNEHIA